MMPVRIRNNDWMDDDELKVALKTYVNRRLHREEILDFVKQSINVEKVKGAVQEELSGPGCLLGYRAMHQKIREVHQLNVPRDLVYAVMTSIDDSGLKDRGNVGKPKCRKREKIFFAEGSDFTLSLDGHDKLCGFQKSVFPLSIYGGQDTYSGKIQFLRISTSNNDPKIIGRYYLDYLYETRKLPRRLRIDRGTETGDLTAIHCYLLDKNSQGIDVTDLVLFGPSTENKIERFWRELHHRLELYFKVQLSSLLESGAYDPGNKSDRLLLAYVFVPVIQKELDIFREIIWNNHRGRKNDKKHLPSGIPEHIYRFPEKYGGKDCSISVTETDLYEVAELSGVYERPVDFLPEDFRSECMRHIDCSEICPSEAHLAFKFLKDNFNYELTLL